MPDVSILNVSVGESITMTCAVQCYPVCSVVWSKESQSVLTRTGALRLRDIGREDSEVYTCKASNVAGSDEKNVVLNVQCE